MRLLLVGPLLALALSLLSACGSDADAGITRGPEATSMVALTFDDGLNGETTRHVAALLQDAGMHGTFFVVGQTIEDQTIEDQAAFGRDLLAHGHVLANHSFDHTRAQPDDREYDQLARTQSTFNRLLGVCPRYFRPPFGIETKHTKRAVRDAGMRTILWDVEVADWSETDAARLAANVLAEVRPGSIVLLHDGNEGRPGADRSVLLAALPAILEGLRARGLRSVGVGELLGEPAYLEGC